MDASAWTLLLLVVAVCAVPVVIEPSWWMILLMGAMEAFAVLTFAGIFSPSRRQEFIARLRAINPNIHVGSQL